jgi:hypothetical protein
MTLGWFPAERMNTDFPWPLWAIGWLGVFKAILWLAWEPVMPEALLRLVGWKYILGAAPALVFGVGLWWRRKWAAWGMTLMAAAELVFLLVLPRSINAYLVDSEVGALSVLLSAVVLVCGGPAGSILILCGAPSMFRATSRRPGASG